MTDFAALARALTTTVHKAGQAEMAIYRGDINVEIKADNSPVTAADGAAEEIILKDLARIAPDIPVVAEEAASAGHIPKTGDRFFLVDPLDGTKEFINKNGEFTVNVALIENGAPSFGIVYAPAVSKLYVTLGADRAVRAGLDPDLPDVDFDALAFTDLALRAPDPAGLTVVASRSHINDETRRFLEGFKVAEMISAGSSMKFCLVAEGRADVYPRLAPTMEWDTAAGHGVLKAAGGSVETADGAPLHYGKAEQKRPYLNPGFIAWGRKPAGLPA